MDTESQPVQALTADALKNEAAAAYQKGDFATSGRVYAAAAQAYKAKEQSVQAAEMENNSSVAWLQAGEPGLSLEAVDGTEAVFAEAGEIRLQAMAIGNKAAALDALGELDQAVTLYEQSAGMLQEIGEGELRAYILQALSKVQFRTGRQLEALATMQAGVDGIERPSLRQRILKRLLRIPMNSLSVSSQNKDLSE